MTDRYWIRLDLLSDATFGRGEGLAGVVDQEVDRDANGWPVLRGRALKGLLVEECANLLYVLGKASPQLTEAAGFLFGQAGSGLAEDGQLHVGPARLPREVREKIGATLKADEAFEAVTAIRRQTAVDDRRGAPETGSLRAMRVILRGTSFVAPLDLDGKVPEAALPLLAACVKALRRAGTGRNRGRGRLRATLHDAAGNDITATCFAQFKNLPEVKA